MTIQDLAPSRPHIRGDEPKGYAVSAVADDVDPTYVGMNRRLLTAN